MDYGFVRVAAAVPSVKVANCEYNAEQIIGLYKHAELKNVQFVVFPELSITSYTCADLFNQFTLLQGAEDALRKILSETRDIRTVAIVGIPIYFESKLFNCAVVLQSGKILGVVPKIHIPSYSEFYEKRWFVSGASLTSANIKLCGFEVPFGIDLLFEDENNRNICFGVEICEDLWVPMPPSSYQSVAGATILFNLSASNELIGKHEYREQLVNLQSAKCDAAYVYTSSNSGESTTDLVFGGHAIISEYGMKIAESERFVCGEQFIYTEIDVEKLVNYRLRNTGFGDGISKREHKKEFRREFRRIRFDLATLNLGEFNRIVERHPFVPSNVNIRDKRCEEIFSIQTSALSKRLRHTGINKAVVGISGGLDSTLALLVTAKTFKMLGIPSENVIAVTLPGFGTTDATYNNALCLMQSMNVTIKEINIKEACLRHFDEIGHDADVLDTTYENVQARERTQILMDIANKIGGLVIGTGDMSELALGWCTYNGDHMSMYAVNCGVPKTLVRFLIGWVADNTEDISVRDVLHRIIDTPISPELLPPDKCGNICQKTEDIVGPYELHDFFLFHMLRCGESAEKVIFLSNKAFAGVYGEEEIKKWLRVFYSRFFAQQFKRSCLPDGPKVGTVSLSPRGDLRMPSDADVKLWIDRLG